MDSDNVKETRRWKTILPIEENSFTNRMIALIRELDAIIWQCYDFSKNEDAGDVWHMLVDDLHSLIDFLRQEHYQGHKIGQEPLIVDLRERLNMAVVTIELYEHEHPNNLCDNFDAVMHLCEDWQDWINRYFPIDPNGQEQPHQEPAQRPKKQSKAAARLQSQELQEVKAKLIAAGIINDDGWQGTPAEFGCLVNELRDERGINDHGRRTWKEVARWAGYHDNIESARSAIEKNVDTEGDVADKIRAICSANK